MKSTATNSRATAAALIAALALIVLLSGAILAFFSMATGNRRIESSRANRAKAAMLAESASLHAVGDLLNQMVAQSDVTATNDIALLKPKTAADSVPQRKLSTAVNQGDANFFNLIQQSVPGADAKSSTHGSGMPARNGRRMDMNLWNLPELLSGAGFENENQLPNWIYVDADNGPSAVPTARTIGRFAYNIYDIGGLLNANAAGHVANPGAVELAYLRSGQGGVDLTKLSTDILQAKVDLLAAFRFPTNYPTAPAAQDFTGWMLGASSNGFLSAYNTHAFNKSAADPNLYTQSGTPFYQNMFSSRQDLLRYVKTQNTSFESALPYLTHFSRSVNAPSWRPPVSATYTYYNPDIPSVRTSAAGTVTHYDDAGDTSFYSVSAGESLMQRRFSLAKLAWLTPTGPAAGISAAAIQSSFGLRWNPAEERWDYVGASGSGTLGSISTLAQVAAESAPREPDFFEYLKAGVLDGSLGSAARNKQQSIKQLMSYCSEDSAILDANKDLHILKMGANIIDCADSDNYPTILALSWGGVAVEKAGVEDLPYFYSLDVANLRTINQEGPSTSYKFSSSDYVWVPELINPHRVSTPSASPAGLKIEIMSGYLRDAGFGENGWLSNLKLRGTPNKDLTALPAIQVAGGTWETYRNAPGPVRDAGASNRLGALVPGATDSDALAFHIFSHGKPADYSPGLPAIMSDALSKIAIVQMDSVVVSLRYRTPGNNWKTYVTMGGYEAFPEDTGIDGIYRDDFEFRVLKHSDSINNSKTIMNVNSPAFISPDPRSSRFGPIMGRYKRPLGHTPRFTTSGTASGSTPAWNYSLGSPNFFNATPNNYAMSFAGNLPQKAGYEDPDIDSQGPRPPDANIGFTGSGATATAANPYKTLTNHDGRPVILQRPYRSVAELGYVFRDMPWQTVNFYNARSGDSALLDLFTVRDEPAVTAGYVALTTRHLPVLKALFAGAAQESDGNLPLTPAQSDALAQALESYAFSSGSPTAAMPSNVSDLAKFMSGAGVTAVSGLSPIKYRREAVIRALAPTQTRTWNVLVDVVAQTGRFSGQGQNASDFLVEGESRLWSSVAIDRYTGKVVGRQKEKVHE